MQIKLGTWNVALPVSASRREELRSFTDKEQSDVWVLTETHDGFTPGHAYHHSSDGGRDGNKKPEHRWVTIWSRFPVQPLVTTDAIRSAATRILPETSAPFIVYGTVLPWTGSNWREFESKGGHAFREALSVQSADWLKLREEYPDDEFFVVGDLNQDLVQSPPRYCGTQTNRRELESALHRAGLAALTANEGDPVRRDSSPLACIDHICARRDSKWHSESAVRWPELDVPNKSLSDHFGISIVFNLG